MAGPRTTDAFGCRIFVRHVSGPADNPDCGCSDRCCPAYLALSNFAGLNRPSPCLGALLAETSGFQGSAPHVERAGAYAACTSPLSREQVSTTRGSKGLDARYSAVRMPART